MSAPNPKTAASDSKVKSSPTVKSVPTVKAAAAATAPAILKVPAKSKSVKAFNTAAPEPAPSSVTTATLLFGIVTVAPEPCLIIIF